MSSEGSITRCLGLLKAGDRAAAQELWDRYFVRLVGLARTTLRGLPRRVAADEEDAALSAFDSFCRRAEAGRFPPSVSGVPGVEAPGDVGLDPLHRLVSPQHLPHER